MSGSAKRTLSRLLGLGIALALLGGLGVFVISGFVEGRQEAAVEAEREGPIKPPLRVKLPARGEPIVTFDAATQKTIGLELMTPSAAPYEDHVRAYGTVLDLANLTTLNTTYVSAVSQLNTAQAKLAASQPAYARAQALYAKDVGSLAQMQTTEAAVLGDKASVSAAESQVRTLAATALQEWGPVIGRALVAQRRIGQSTDRAGGVSAADHAPPSVSIDPPPTASVEVGGSSRRVDVRYISPATRTDPKIQGLSFFYAAAANSGVLPGMNVRAYLASGHSVEGYIVPTAAVVWWSGRAWVYLRLDEDSFSRREIPTDTPTRDGNGFVVPVHAFGEADDPPQIVTKAAQLLLSEEFRAQIQVGGDND